MSKPVDLECCCCGLYAGKFQQHWNRDDGYGICQRCVTDEINSGASQEQIKSNYGQAGINYQGANHEHTN